MSVVRRASTSEIKRVVPNQVEGAQSHQARKPIHHINQLRPEGAGKDYANGPFNCGPAVVAMLARSAGKLGHLNDAQLVSELGKGVVTEKGTSPEGIATMMARAGVSPDGQALGAGYTDAQLKEHLGKGNKMVAQVRSSNPNSQKDSAHYVVIEGQTRNGNYIVSDPLAKGPYVVSPKQLKEAVLKAPPDGGMLIPVANPGKQAAATVPTSAPQVIPGTLGAPNELSGEPIEAISTNPSLAAVQGMDSFVTRPATAAVTAAPDPKAFTASEEMFKGVDTEFKATDSKPTDKVLVQNERRNTFELDVSYSKPSLGEKIKEAVTSAVENVGDFIRNLFSLKSKGDAKAYETLSKLESSTFKEDKEVLKEIKQSDKKDPGTGVKIQGDAF
ncbi:MAG TPA: C39 family peptidase [Myxococcaceae bacterium]|nr:C39 family peptidase [Myxococcaceae bacterium]